MSLEKLIDIELLGTFKQEQDEYNANTYAKIGESGNTSITVDDVMSETSTNPVQNKVIKEYVDSKEISVSEKENNAIVKETDGLYVEISSGKDGEDGITPSIGENGNWYFGDVDSGVNAKASVVTIGSDTNWYIDGVNQNVKAKGEDGKDGKSIKTISKDDENNIITTFTDGTTENIGQLNIDVQADFLTDGGFGKLRYLNGKFQYYDTASSAWIDTSVSPENVYIMQMIPQTMESFDGLYDVDLGRNKLRWTEPKDTIIDGQVCCLVEKVVIRRKLGSTPINEADGDLVIEVKRSEFGSYANTWFVDEDLTPTIDEVWCYKAFPISTTGFCNSSSINEKYILCKDYHLYGFQLDQNESDPASMITYLSDCDNSGFKSTYMNYTTGLFNYGDWANAWFMNVKPCMLNYDGTVAYYLNPDDYTLKEDNTVSDIADDTFEGNAMIGFPKVYWKIVDNDDNTVNIYFSDKKVDEDFVCWSHIDNNGNEIDYCYMPIYNGSNVNSVLRSISGKTPIYNQTGTTEITYALANNVEDNVIWYTEVFSDRMLVNLLLLLIGKSTDTQTVFGNGHYTGGSSASNLIMTGTMNKKGLFWGTNGTGYGVKVFGMEHWWGNQWRRLAGWINNKGAQMIKLTYGQSDGSTVDGYNTTSEGYININCTPSGTSGGYISKMTVTKNGLIPTTASGSATTYYTDGLWFNNSQVDYAVVGGSSGNGLRVGALCSDLSSLVSNADWHDGAAVSCKPLA